jgi:hypothetical protein
LAGKERWMRPTADIGFHRGRVIGSRTGMPYRDDVGDALRGMGTSERFIAKVLITSPDDIWMPQKNELLGEHVVTDIADPDRFTFCFRDPTPEAIRKWLEQDPVFEAIEEVDPAGFRELVNGYLAGPARGMTLKELQTWGGSFAKRAFEEANCHPSVAQAKAHALEQATLAAIVSKRFPDRCAQILGGLVDAKDLPLGDFDVSQATRAFIVAGYRSPSPEPSEAEVLDARKAWTAKLAPATREVMRDRRAKKTIDADALCAAARDYHAAMAALEPEQIVKLNRAKCPAK